MPDQTASHPIDAETTPALGLPFILNGQAQKHVTHNEALVALDALVQLAVLSAGENDPPAEPAEGDPYIVGDAPTGAWADRAGAVAAFTGGAWRLFEPKPGWIAVHDGTALVRGEHGWRPLAGASGGGGGDATGGVTERTDRLGVNTDADDTNRLAVASPATLLTHAGSDHRVVVNRAGDSDTASLMFQSGWSGRAEMGLTGDGGFRIKSSADGAAWVDALTVDPATGAVEMPATIRPAAALFPPEFSREHARGEAFALKALVDTRKGLSADGTTWVVPQGGLYLLGVSLVPRAKTDSRAGVDVMGGTTRLFRCIFNTTVGTPSFAAMNMNALAAGTPITFRCYTGTAGGTASLWHDTRFLVVRLG